MLLNATATPVFASLNTTKPADDSAKTAAEKQPELVQPGKATLPKYQETRSARQRVRTMSEVPDTANQGNKRNAVIPGGFSSYVDCVTAGWDAIPTNPAEISAWVNSHANCGTAISPDYPIPTQQIPSHATAGLPNYAAPTTLATATSASNRPPSTTYHAGAGGLTAGGTGTLALLALGLHVARNFIQGR